MKIKTTQSLIFRSLLLASATILFLSGAHARTWTSSDGAKTFDGELLSYDPETGAVGVTLANGKVMKFAQDKLSAADITFLKEQGKVDAAPADKKGTVPAKSSTGKIDADPKNLFKPSDGKPADMSKPVQVFVLMGQSNAIGFGKVAGLETLVKQDKKYPYLADASGNWVVRQDVRNVRVMASGGGAAQEFYNEWLTVSGKTIGVDIGIGYALGSALDAPVLVIKSCIGNRALSFDLLPPGADGYAGNLEGPRKPKEGAEWYAGIQYDADVHAAQNVLADLKKYYPDATKYEVAGFFFWQGEKDNGKAEWAGAYEKNLVQFIKALRKDFESPNAKFVLATLGEDTKGCGKPVFDAHMAVDGKEGKYPDFKGNVATVYSNPLSKGGSGNGHYSGNPETYMNVGEAMGQAMAELLAK